MWLPILPIFLLMLCIKPDIIQERPICLQKCEPIITQMSEFVNKLKNADVLIS